MSSQVMPPQPNFPSWANQLRNKYMVGEASVFVLYQNVFDHVLCGDTTYGLTDFLHEQLLYENKSFVAEVSLDRGLRVLQGSDTHAKAELYQYLQDKGLPGIFTAVERRMQENTSNAIIFPYAETIFPRGETQFLSNDERIAFTSLHRWSLDDSLSSRDNVIILICESLTQLNPALLSSPKVATIKIPLPDQAERLNAIKHYAPKLTTDHQALLAKHTGGLRAIQIKSIVASDMAAAFSETERKAFITELLAGQADAAARAEKLATITAGMTADEIRALVAPDQPTEPVEENSIDDEMLTLIHKRKQELIEKECAGLIEFMKPKVGLDAVGGNENIKHELMAIAQAVKSGDVSRSPMGLLAVGPMGAGKTFVTKAFLKESGLPAVVLKNFRSKWVGSTEANLDKVLATVKAMGPIAVVIDEGDRSFGGATGDQDGGTSSRVIARLKDFMSDTDNRGHVLMILMTNRPDKLDTDLKRPGRLDQKIPFFYAETTEARADILRAILSRYDVDNTVDWSTLEDTLEKMSGYSNADLEAVALLAVQFAQRGSDQTLDNEILKQAVDDFMPPRDVVMIELMEMLAVFEASRRSLLPKRFQDMTAKQVNDRIIELKHKLRLQ